MKYFLLFFILFTPQYISGQGEEERIVFSKVDISEEIYWPIHSIYQDLNGTMWFSGKNYLMYYDGIRFDSISLRHVEEGLSITGRFPVRLEEAAAKKGRQISPDMASDPVGIENDPSPFPESPDHVPGCLFS